jgi:hypothetical protein
MVGTINLSLTQQLDEYGKPLSGGQLYIIQAGTISTPQNAYQDTGLTLALPNPITLDAAGRIPQFFLADGQIKVRLQDASGVVKFTQDNLLVIGPSAGGGGGGSTVDPTTVLATGDIKVRYDVAVLAGFVRCNGRTIGNGASGATELADPSSQALFNYLWGKDATLAVTPGGRGASAALDWTDSKQIALPDFRGKGITALSDMGSSDSGLLAGITFSKGNATTLGSIAGSATRAIPVGALPSHQHAVFLKENPHGHAAHVAGTIANVSGTSPTLIAITGSNPMNPAGTTVMGNVDTALTNITVGSVSGTANDNQTANTGAGSVMDNTDPMMLITVYMKL